MDHFVKLSRWPSQLNIPSEYANAFVLDQEHSRIGYHGYMRKADFDALATASRDPAYLDGLQALFAQSIYEGPQAKRRVTAWLVVGALVAAGIVSIAALYLSRR